MSVETPTVQPTMQLDRRVDFPICSSRSEDNVWYIWIMGQPRKTSSGD